MSQINSLKLTDDGFSEKLVKEYASEGKGAFLYDAAIEVTINEEIKGPKRFYFFMPNGDSQWADGAFSTDGGLKVGSITSKTGAGGSTRIRFRKAPGTITTYAFRVCYPDHVPQASGRN
jgi:hypothetical protein